MSLEITGKLIAKYEQQSFGEKQFKTREFVIELAEEVNGNVYTNFAKIQLVQAKCDIVDRFNIGEIVKVSFNVRGRSYVDKKDGSTKYISNLDAWRIESCNGTNAAPQPVVNNNNKAATPAFGAPAPNFNPSPETLDDLLF